MVLRNAHITHAAFQMGSQLYGRGTNPEQQLEAMKHGNSGGRPPRNPRDTRVLLCGPGGIVLGCTAGVIIGTLAGEYFKKCKYRKLANPAKDSEADKEKGAFVK